MSTLELATYLDGYPGLTPEEVVLVIGMSIGSASMETARKMLESIAGGGTLVSAYARNFLEVWPRAGDPQGQTEEPRPSED